MTAPQVLRQVLDNLTKRKLIADVTSPRFVETICQRSLASGPPPSAYCGYDPTADSLHLGNMVTLMTLKHLQTAGIRPIIVLGGATGLIGDPSGKSEERIMLTDEIISANSEGIRQSLGTLLDFEGGRFGAKIVNNIDWHGQISAIQWLRDIGSRFRLNSMLSKESVRKRLESDSGISFLEFSYQIFQAYDFLHLYQTENCPIQVGGSDQWGNITAGCELIRRHFGSHEHYCEPIGITVPLLTTASGMKFGKSEGNAVWLNRSKTSEYSFYQYFLNSADADVERLLKCFTLLPLPDIEEAVSQHLADPGKRSGQRLLAEQVTELVHGRDGLRKAEMASQVLFGGSLERVSAQELIDIARDVPSSQLPIEAVLGQKVTQLAVKSKALTSQSEARRLIQGGGLYLNNKKVSAPDAKISEVDLIDGQACLLRVGRQKYTLVTVA